MELTEVKLENNTLLRRRKSKENQGFPETERKSVKDIY